MTDSIPETEDRNSLAITCFLISDKRYPGDRRSNSIPDRVESVHENWTVTGVGLDGPFMTSNLARSEPRPESCDA